jgi:hypothetical protein
VAHFGGGRVPLVLNPGSLDSTRTPFLHREGRGETGGMNSTDRGRMEIAKSGRTRGCDLIFDNLVAMEE